MGKSDWRLEGTRVKVSGKLRHLWKAIDQDGEMLDFCVTETEDRDAALAILRRRLQKYPHREKDA
jgi:transposase-like protein